MNKLRPDTDVVCLLVQYIARQSGLILLYFLFLLIPALTTAQFTYELDKTTRFDKIGVKDGLTTEIIECVYQDKYGFIWIGTSRGLNLYDGYKIKEFIPNPKDTSTIIASFITGIFEEKDGTMWFFTPKGMSEFNRSNQTFTSHVPDKTDSLSFRNNIQKIIEDGDYLWVDVSIDLFRFNKQTGEFKSFGKDTLNPNKGIYGSNSDYIFLDNSETLWVSSSEPPSGKVVLCRFNKEDETFAYFKNETNNPESFNGKGVNSMIEDRDGTIWIATNYGGLLEVLDKDNGKFRQYLHDDSDTNSIITNRLLTIFEDSKGNIWVGGRTGFSLFNKNNKQFTNYQIPNRSYRPDMRNYIEDIIEDESGILWLTSWEGLFKFNTSTGNLLHYLDHDDDISLGESTIMPVLIDHSGQPWVGTATVGMRRLNKFSNIFRQIKIKRHVNNINKSNYVGRVYGDSKNNLWLGCYIGGGLFRTTINDQKVYTNFDRFEFIPDDPKTINIDYIYAIYEDNNQTIWVGGWAGFNKYNAQTNTFTRFRNDPKDTTSLSSSVVKSICEDSFGSFWLGTSRGLNIMDRVNEKFIRFIPNDNDSTSISSSVINVIFEDSQGDLWFGGNYLERLNREDTSFTPYTINENYSHFDLTNIYDIAEDYSANLWVATGESGLIKISTIKDTFEIFTMENGLPSNSIVGIEIDDNGDIWVVSNKGLSRLSSNGEIRNFDIADGLIDLEIIERSFYKDKDGWLYFGTRGGLNVFHPDSIKENDFVPPVYITAINVAGQQKYFEKPLYEMENIQLKYNENDFSFDFVALNYINPQKNQYAFWLEGYDEDWIYVGNRRTAYYTNLSPGTYTFRVKGSNNDGYWNEEGASLVVIIHPPFWATWWAYAFYLLAFFGILYLVRRGEIRKIHLRQELEIKETKADNLTQLDEEKNKFFSNISHEFRTPLTLILGPLEKIIAGSKNKETGDQLRLVQRNARRLQTLINQLLSLSKLESGKMELRARSENIVTLTCLFLESFQSMADERGIRTEFHRDEEEHTVYIDPLKYEKIINNLLSNAFKFTEKGGKIKVSVSKVDSSSQDNQTVAGVLIKVADTGIGIRKEKLEHVFDRFYQVDEQQMKTNLGTGIGLALTKELVELHHGNIAAESEPGMGTTFFVFLPMGKSHLTEDEIIETSKDLENFEDGLLRDDVSFVQDIIPKPATTEKENPAESDLPLLLIVEDNTDMRAYIKSYLTDSYRVLEATNGREGAAMAIEHLPDLIISDLMMPFVDGREMTEQLKSDEKTSHIPIILLTAKSSTATKLEGLETGADDFLTKPFDAAELLVRIKNLIEQRQRIRAMLSHHIGDVNHTKIIRETSGKAISKLDEQFLEKTKSAIEKHMSNPDFSVEMLAQEVGMSRTQLHRKLKGLVNLSPSDVIRDIRLDKAAELLTQGELNVTQVTYEIGISSLSYFSKAFKEKYGCSPSEYPVSE